MFARNVKTLKNAQSNNEIMRVTTTTTKVATPDAIVALSNNEETEIAAIVFEDLTNMSKQSTTEIKINATAALKTLKTELLDVIKLSTATASTVAPILDATITCDSFTEEFGVPAPAPGNSRSSATGGVFGASSSLRKKRNKSTRKRYGNEAQKGPESTTYSIAATSHRNDNLQSKTVASATCSAAAGSSTGKDDVAAIGGAIAASIKTTLSMRSLPLDDEMQENRDVIKAKLKTERPYNSLKKSSDRSMCNSLGRTPTLGGSSSGGSGSNYNKAVKNSKHHRYSWGSGHSHSSSSLQSSATLGLGSFGNDDLWAAIQTNYNYIMDTNLLDTCQEARGEIENATSVLVNPIKCCFKLLDETHRTQGSYADPKELRKWLREMEHKMEYAPSLSEATLFSHAELQLHLAEHSVLYHEIVSHARVVNACIRAASEKEQQQQRHLVNSNAISLAEQNNSSPSSTDEPITSVTTATKSTSSSSGVGSGEAKSAATKTTLSETTCTTLPIANAGSSSTTTSKKNYEGSLERLQNRYHLLYLKAFEVQLWLDGLLRKKGSSSIVNDYIVDDDDEDEDAVGVFSECCDEGSATENYLNEVVSDLESDVQHHSSSSCDLQHSNNNCEGLATAQSSIDFIQNKDDCDDGDDEHEEENTADFSTQNRKRIWPLPRLSYCAVELTGTTVRKQPRATTAVASVATTTASPSVTLTDIEADSESSDLEVAQTLLRRQRKFNQQQQKRVPTAAFVAASTTATAATMDANLSYQRHQRRTPHHGMWLHASSVNATAAPFMLQQVEPTMQTKISILVSTAAVDSGFNQNKHNNYDRNAAMTTPATTSAATQTPELQQTKLLTGSSGNMLIPATVTLTKPKNIAIISPNNSHNIINIINNNKNSSIFCNDATKQSSSVRKQQRHADISTKFNRSNRKSKNCAIFYFKHLDTDNETSFDGGGGGDGSGLSSSEFEASILLKSVNASIDDIDDNKDYDDDDRGDDIEDEQTDVEEEGDDDDSWLYTSMPPTVDTNSTSNKKNSLIFGSSSNSNNNSTVFIVDDLQSPEISSFTPSDSDKENKEADVPRHSLLVAELQLATVTSSSIAKNRAKTTTTTASISSSTATSTTKTTTSTVIACADIGSSSDSAGICGSGSSYCDSSCSSNELLTIETATTTSVATTTTTQIEQKHRSEMKMQFHDALAVGPACKSNPIFFYTRADICNIKVQPSGRSDMSTVIQQQQAQLLNPGKRLPPRSPTKSTAKLKPKSLLPNAIATFAPATTGPIQAKVSHDSIVQLVREAEQLVRGDETLLMPKQKHQLAKISPTRKKREMIMPGPVKQRVQEWLEHQPPLQPVQLLKSHDLVSGNGSQGGAGARTDDCEASGEASETDSIPQPSSDTSEGFTDSIATCMQTSTNSFGNSAERIGGSAEPIIGATGGRRGITLGYGSSNQSLNVKIIKRQPARRKSERPWSVSCLSQLTTDVAQISVGAKAKVAEVQAGLVTHSISESALDSLSPGRSCAASASLQTVQVKSCDSKSSLKRRKTRKKRHSNASATPAVAAAAVVHVQGRHSDSGSEGSVAGMPKLTQTLLMKSCESMSPHQIQEIANALINLQIAGGGASAEQIAATGVQPSQQIQQSQINESDEEAALLMKPNFRVGSYTTAYMRSEARLGSLAALATYMNDDEQQEYTTGTDDHHSSFSETAWDNYQEKYNSENYSEGFDSDAARRLMEFGDDYRNFIDSQSDCCSSLSAANNLDSLSPPRIDSLQQNEARTITQEGIASSVDHARRRRALELEYERRRKTLEVRRKSCQDSSDNQNSLSCISFSSSANALSSKNAEISNNQKKFLLDSMTRKLEFGGMSHSAQSLGRASESDTSIRRRKIDERRRSSRNLEKTNVKPTTPVTSSSSCDNSDEEKEMRNLLQQSHNRLEDTRSLKIRCHMLRPEDYSEIISTCRDNIRCLESVLRGPPGTVLSSQCNTQTKDLLAAWVDLLGWSKNAAAARKMQEEMIIMKYALNRLGNKSILEQLDTEPAIQIAIAALESEKSQLQTYRTNMLRLNATVHSWLTRQERKLQTALTEQQLLEALAKVNTELPKKQAREDGEDERNPIEKQSEQKKIEGKLRQQLQILKSSTAVCVTGSNGHSMVNQMIMTDAVTTTTTMTSTAECDSTVVSVGSVDKALDLKMLMNSEKEFNKHLKDEVSDMYSAWDEADARINAQLEMLTTSQIAWRQLESGLSEFHLALGQDRGTLKGLEGALNKGQATPIEMAQNVKLVAKLLSEKVNVSQEQLAAVQEHLDPNHILYIAKFTASNGSLSDSGISDGGTTSDGGLSERERRLSVLRRLAKQLESALAPGSDTMKSIAARMESAEAELKNLQNTCRDLIVRTAATHQNKIQQLQLQLVAKQRADNKSNANGNPKAFDHAGDKKTVAEKQSQLYSDNFQSTETSTKRKNKRKHRANSKGSCADGSGGFRADGGGDNVTDIVESATLQKFASQLVASHPLANADCRNGDPLDDPSDECKLDTSDDDESKASRGWAWRIAKAAVPMQLALFTFLAAACLMQPNCCDNLNNLSMSFTPQLRYIRGPPPI